jgi:hypothetical protein
MKARTTRNCGASTHDHRKSSFKEYRMLHYNIGIKLATLKDAHAAKQRLLRLHHGSHRTASMTVS